MFIRFTEGALLGEKYRGSRKGREQTKKERAGLRARDELQSTDHPKGKSLSESAPHPSHNFPQVILHLSEKLRDRCVPEGPRGSGWGPTFPYGLLGFKCFAIRNSDVRNVLHWEHMFISLGKGIDVKSVRWFAL